MRAATTTLSGNRFPHIIVCGINSVFSFFGRFWIYHWESEETFQGKPQRVFIRTEKKLPQEELRIPNFPLKWMCKFSHTLRREAGSLSVNWWHTVQLTNWDDLLNLPMRLFTSCVFIHYISPRTWGKPSLSPRNASVSKNNKKTNRAQMETPHHRIPPAPQITRNSHGMSKLPNLFIAWRVINLNGSFSVTILNTNIMFWFTLLMWYIPDCTDEKA